MELHHSKHHQTYVTGLNTVLDQLAEARAAGSFGSIGGLEKNLALNLGGHLNHSVFWTNLSPVGGDKPTGELAAAIDDHFGSFDAFRGQFTANALVITGSGCSILGWDSVGKNLLVFQLYDQQGNASASHRSSCSTCGSTPSTCSTATSRPTTSRPGGTSSTGPTPPPASTPPALRLPD
jgi:Fe-Mn family superoxide dismutase